MEIPLSISSLYRHWSLHTKKDAVASRSFTYSSELINEITAFIDERMRIWKRKTIGSPPPYTEDPILATYRFCNILREFDRQTIYFHTLLNPLRDHFPLWLLNMFYCRMVARPETIEHTGLLSFDVNHLQHVHKTLINSPRPRFGTPYVFPISTILKSPTPTRELFITHHLPSNIPRVATLVETWKNKSVYDGVQEILPLFGVNLSFLWTEVLIDIAYQYPQRINLFARFPIGPGAAPTLSRINSTIDPSHLVANLATLPVEIGVTWQGKTIQLSAENWEGIGCEFRKYTNLKSEKGRKRLYKQ